MAVKLKCLRPKCRHEWESRKTAPDGGPPTGQDRVRQCPHCKSPVWDRKPRPRGRPKRVKVVELRPVA